MQILDRPCAFLAPTTPRRGGGNAERLQAVCGAHAGMAIGQQAKLGEAFIQGLGARQSRRGGELSDEIPEGERMWRSAASMRSAGIRRASAISRLCLRSQ